MTLQTFLRLTAETPRLPLRRAMAIALAVETPCSPDGYARFYTRVIDELPRDGRSGSCAGPGHRSGPGRHCARGIGRTPLTTTRQRTSLTPRPER
jgi:hypothetical protein